MKTAFIHYVATALWSSNDDKDQPLDDDHDATDLAPDTYNALRQTLNRFLKENEDLISEALEHTDLEQIAHDLWLTQNGHGAGFWGGDYPEKLGEKLTKAADKMGGINLYVGDDGKIYHM